jgi:DNA-binding response OmpR family regulator
MLISRLREKLDDEPRKPRFIRTIRMGGYQFVGAVRK